MTESPTATSPVWTTVGLQAELEFACLRDGSMFERRGRAPARWRSAQSGMPSCRARTTASPILISRPFCSSSRDRCLDLRIRLACRPRTSTGLLTGAPASWFGSFLPEDDAGSPMEVGVGLPLPQDANLVVAEEVAQANERVFVNLRVPAISRTMTCIVRML